MLRENLAFHLAASSVRRTEARSGFTDKLAHVHTHHHEQARIEEQYSLDTNSRKGVKKENFTSVYECMYVCMYVPMYVRACVNVNVYMCVYSLYSQIYTHVCVRVNVNVHMIVCTFDTHKFIRMYICVCACVCVCASECVESAWCVRVNDSTTTAPVLVLHWTRFPDTHPSC